MADHGGALPLDLLEGGDPSFVDAIRAVDDAEALADFAGPWFDDRRPASRRLLFEYLDRPPDAFRHEGLIKRLFKKAEAEGDDPLMARFLVLFDRSIRRRLTGPDRKIAPPRRSTLPRDRELLAEKLEKLRPLRLFRVATRNYLRRRAWRYFRRLGKTHPGRYVAAVSEALALYRDEDVADPLALIDNWGLIHILFHHSPALKARPQGWTPRTGPPTGRLAPAPIFESLWDQAPVAVVGLLAGARSRTVRRWAARRIEADPVLHRPALSLDGWLDLLGHHDPEVVALAAEVLDRMEGLEALGVDRWLALAESTDPSALEPLCELIGRYVDGGQVTPAQAARLAVLRPLPVARLGFAWLERKTIDPEDLRTVLGLVDAESEALRPEILGWLRGVLAASPGFEPSMVLDFLDSRHADVRAEGWSWFRADPRAGDDIETWRKLLESPHDDIRLALVGELEARAGGDDPSRIGRGLDPEALRQLWATVLLDVFRGSRVKPGVVRQLLRRLEASPGEAPELLPLLGLALRSVRGPERRAALVAIVRLVEAREEVGSLVRSSFPELQMS